MKFIKGVQRDEVLLLPESLDEYVHADNPVRFIDQFVDGLDLNELGFAYPKEDIQQRGRPAYDPGDLLKLLIYGYSNGIRSGRKLQKACSVNVELMWLLKKLAPDFKTICDFRRRNRKCLKSASAQFTLLCQRMNLISAEFIAVDGSLIKASNNKEKSWNQSKIDSALKRNEDAVEHYLKQIEDLDGDAAADSARRNKELQKKLAKVKAQKKRLDEIKEAVNDSKLQSIAYTDKDSRPLKKGDNRLVGYNVQHAVDGKHHLIIAAEVTQKSTDYGLLYPTIQAAEEVLGKLENCKLLADKGYYESSDLKNCADGGYTTYIPEQRRSGGGKGHYTKDSFRYNKEKDHYTCPADQVLARDKMSRSRGKDIVLYRNKSICGNCTLKARCTSAAFRTIGRWVHEDYLERNRQRVDENPDYLTIRKSIVEHPFGTIKEFILSGGFRVRGIENVQAELSLAQLAYNLKRVTKLIPMADLLAMVRSFIFRPYTEPFKGFYGIQIIYKSTAVFCKVKIDKEQKCRNGVI